jgi:hypothetical protein
MAENVLSKKKIDIRDIACDGYGLTAETSGINRYMSKYLEKLKVESEHKPAHPEENSIERQDK